MKKVAEMEKPVMTVDESYEVRRTDGLQGNVACGPMRSRGHLLKSLPYDKLKPMRLVFADTGEEYVAGQERACAQCGKHPTAEGHDACLGELPGVSFACCGHGVGLGYIVFKDSTVIRFKMSVVEKLLPSWPELPLDHVKELEP